MSGARRLRIAAGALALTVVFVAARFPWQRLTPAAERIATEAAGRPVQLGAVGLEWGTLGVAAVANEVRVSWPEGAETAFRSVAARPALSLSWLSGDPLLRILTEGGPGDFDGVAGPHRIEGSLSVPEAGELPWTFEPPVTGPLRGDLELTLAPGLILGGLELEGRDGSLLPPGLPVAVPFDRLSASVSLTPKGLVLDPLVLEGPLASGRVTGTIEPPGGRWAVARLDLVVEIDHFDPGLGAALSQYGFDLRAGSRLTIQGTATHPRVR